MSGKPNVAAINMTVGLDGKGRHWTQAEVEARRNAEDSLQRKTKIVLRCPAWLMTEEKKDARAVWNRVKKQAADFDLLDELDADMLGIYCDAVVKYQETGSQSWARIVASYADRLGLTPSARARLAQKRAVEVVDEFGDEFDN
jgi:phage terminase small subunit